MRKLAALAMFLTLALLGGCGDTHDSLVDEMIATSKEIPGIFAGVKDDASAKAAVEQLKALTTRMEDIKARGKALGDPPKPKQEELEKRMLVAQGELKTQMEPVLNKLKENPTLLLPLLDPLLEMQKKLRPK